MHVSQAFLESTGEFQYRVTGRREHEAQGEVTEIYGYTKKKGEVGVESTSVVFYGPDHEQRAKDYVAWRKGQIKNG